MTPDIFNYADNKGERILKEKEGLSQFCSSAVRLGAVDTKIIEADLVVIRKQVR